MGIPPDQARKALEHLITDYYENYDDRTRALQSEANVRANFIDRLFSKVLGWPVDDPAYYNREQYVRRAGFADIALKAKADSDPVLFVEAKRFGAIEPLNRVQLRRDLEVARLQLPGMSVDRTREEQQAINYAYEQGIRWAVLTNFEQLRLFDAFRDTLVLSFETPRELQERFEELWYLSFEEAQRGRLDELHAHRERADIDAEYLNLINVWRLRLGEDIYGRKGNRTLLINPHTGDVDIHKLRDAVQRILDRLVVIRYAEDRLVIEPDQLYRLVETTRRVRYLSLPALIREFFYGFNVQHDGTLFADHLCDRLEIGQDVLSAVIHNLYDARFRAMSPDIMGNTYEQYLGQTLVIKDDAVQTADNLETRKHQGSYYTPEYIVRYIVDQTLGRLLYATENGQPDGIPVDAMQPKTLEEIDGTQGRPLKVLDPASGSGSFLIYAYQVLETFYQRGIKQLQVERDARASKMLADRRMPMDIRIELADLDHRLDDLKDYRNRILERHLYGVDLDPQAAELAAVNLMLRALKRGWRLPLILNQNIKVGNSLICGMPMPPTLEGKTDFLEPITAQLSELRHLRLQQQNLSANGNTVEGLQSRIDTLRSEVNATLNSSLTEYFDDVETRHPFNWIVEFPEVFLDEDGHWLRHPGFDIVFGNPPYVRMENFTADKTYYRTVYESYEERSDLYIYFMELSHRLLRMGGLYGVIVSNKFFRARYGQPLRAWLANHATIDMIVDFGDLPVFDGITAYPAIIITQRLKRPEQHPQLAIIDTLDSNDLSAKVSSEAFRLASDAINGDLWRLIDHHSADILKRMESQGCSLEKYTGAPVYRGIVTGFNDAFCIDNDTYTRITTKTPQAKEILKPLLTGSDIQRYGIQTSKAFLIYTHHGIDIKQYPEVEKHLHVFKPQLEKRANNQVWHELQQPQLAYQGDFENPKIIFPDIAASCRFALDSGGSYCLNTAYFIPGNDLYLLAVLNSKAAFFYLSRTNAVYRGGYLRFFGQYLEPLPIPYASNEEKQSLARLAQTMLDLNQVQQIASAIFADCLIAHQHVQRDLDRAYVHHDQYREYNLSRSGPAYANAVGTVTNVYVREVEDKLEIHTVTEGASVEQRLIGWEIADANLRRFLLLAIRRFLGENARRKIWSRGPVLRGVLQALDVPVLDERSAERNIAAIAEFMDEVRHRTASALSNTLGNRVANIPDPLAFGEIETVLTATDRCIDTQVFKLYGINNPTDIDLIEKIAE
ncbi:MAG: N-6 DNA methylase [Anaerolineae bacterium]|nr:N-6 DNA methylase [Anaerolineae bacterium]